MPGPGAGWAQRDAERLEAEYDARQEQAASEPVAVWTGTFRLLGVDVRCHVLSTGQRVIDEESMLALMAAMADDSANLTTDAMGEFGRWLKGLDGSSPR